MTRHKYKQVVVSSSATRSSGTLTIYKQFLEHLPSHLDGKHYTIFVHPTMPQPDIEGVEYVHVHTEGQFQRIWFDWRGSKKIIESLNIEPDLIISLQNTGLRCLRGCPQLIYYHLPFPFYNYKYDLTNKRELSLELYKKFYPFFVKKSVGKDAHFVAQIPFIAENIVQRFGVPYENVHTLFPDLEQVPVDSIEEYRPWNDGKYHFVLPATGFRYKGHATLVEALSLAKKKIGNSVMMHFTIEEATMPEVASLVKERNVGEMVEFIGSVPHEKLLSMYKSSAGLLFPSVIETLGLPLIEAAAFGLPIAVSDVRYAHEVIGNYDGVAFLEPYNYEQWAEAICELANKKQRFDAYRITGESSWNEFYRIVDDLLK